MIDKAKECGCDCVKFQSWSEETLYCKTHYKENPIAKRIVKKFSFGADQLYELAQYCDQVGIDFSSTPYSEEEAEFLAKKSRQATAAFRRGSGRNAVSNPSSGKN
jgi:N-acetylneuraminate synthase